MTDEMLIQQWTQLFNLMVLMRQTSTRDFQRAAEQWTRLNREVRKRKLSITPD